MIGSSCFSAFYFKQQKKHFQYKCHSSTVQYHEFIIIFFLRECIQLTFFIPYFHYTGLLFGPFHNNPLSNGNTTTNIILKYRSDTPRITFRIGAFRTLSVPKIVPKNTWFNGNRRPTRYEKQNGTIAIRYNGNMVLILFYS